MKRGNVSQQVSSPIIQSQREREREREGDYSFGSKLVVVSCSRLRFLVLLSFRLASFLPFYDERNKGGNETEQNRTHYFLCFLAVFVRWAPLIVLFCLYVCVCVWFSRKKSSLFLCIFALFWCLILFSLAVWHFCNSSSFIKKMLAKICFCLCVCCC